MAEIVLLKKAVKDIQESRDWYDEKEDNLGRLFVEKVQECITRIAENPKAYPQKYKSLRAGIVPTFPHAVFYKIEKNNVIRVYACVHHKQNTDRILDEK